MFLVASATAFCILARSGVGTTALTQLISLQTRHPFVVLRPLRTTSYSTSGSLPTPAKQELAPCLAAGTHLGSLQHDLAARCPADTPDGTLQRLLLLASQALRAEGLATLQRDFLVPLPV